MEERKDQARQTKMIGTALIVLGILVMFFTFTWGAILLIIGLIVFMAARAQEN
ncbi:hypothetical protein [Deinococcus cellulosilyticus]|uniref:Uncharacterized protein n=1 Tax=Deinococcus cellulosilyticus (strain DSM 18568 / NBRC 106333 / KACC 11606 / 5516J-15) TaxID=1223518 RepID=A0A511N3Z5_DEIC1|nr:hypothetical protein [Deinococcus cellulosilyticus]GEM47217.1 hypothetical protein DC3_28520 [Deinococcus cellulosilyticus NBRC 106333 = KACC 11606]